MSFEDIVLAPSGSIGNYSALYKKSSVQQLNNNSPQLIEFETTVQGIPVVADSYPVPPGAVVDGVSLTVTANLIAKINKIIPSAANITFIHYFYKNSEIIFTSPPNLVTLPPQPPNSFQSSSVSLISPTVTLPPGTFISGDNISYYIKVSVEGNPLNTQVGVFFGTPDGISPATLTVSQYPIFSLPVTSSGVNSIWNWGNKTTYPYIITSSNSTLVQLYGNPNVKAKNITGSSFNTIQLPWKINYGDEFKFEGREDFSYMVKKIYAPADSGSGRVFKTGSLEVHFNANLPVSASSSVFNLDHFLIRRYVDDAAQNIITGFKPPGSTGPYLIKPEFVVPELNKSIDEVILDLTQKGLIT